MVCHFSLWFLGSTYPLDFFDGYINYSLHGISLRGFHLHLFLVWFIFQLKVWVFHSFNMELDQLSFHCVTLDVINTEHCLLTFFRNYMNDALRSDVFMRYNPETVACACIYLSARYMNITLPRQPPWYGLFKVNEGQILDICRTILLLYKRPKVRALQFKP